MSSKIGKQVIIRTLSAGVHFGKLTSHENKEGAMYVTLENTRRIWQWAGSNSLSELATLGTDEKEKCNFSLPVLENDLMATEIILCTPEGAASLHEVPLWAYNKDNKEVLKANSLSQ